MNLPKSYKFEKTDSMYLRPVPESHGGSNGSKSFWVEFEATKGNYEWLGNLHLLKSGKVEACPKNHPCASFENPYLAIDYIRIKTFC